MERTRRALHAALHPTLGAAGFMILAAASLRGGLRPLSDNSFFTHLATGRLLLDTNSVPAVDPYTYTAHGADWVVQSWFMSLIYGITESVAGAGGLRVLFALSLLGILGITWVMTRAVDGIVTRMAVAYLVFAVGAGFWAERPFMTGLLGIGFTALAGNGQIGARWLLAIGWIWVNSHGSFPLGLVLLGVLAVGSRLDGQPIGTELRAMKWLAGGVVLGGFVNPVGPRLLLFPVELLARQEVLSLVSEWQAPRFTTMDQRLFLVEVVALMLLVMHRPSWRNGLVLGVFTAAAMVSARNVAVASIVFVPIIATTIPQLGSLRASARNLVGQAVTIGCVAYIAVTGPALLNRAHYDLRGFPVAALDYLDEHQVDLTTTRIAGDDYLGNYMNLRYGPRGSVFHDDRVDMFPTQVTYDMVALLSASSTYDQVLDRYDIDLVIGLADDPITQVLGARVDWRVLLSDDGWVLHCRQGSDLGPELRRCSVPTTTTQRPQPQPQP